MKTFGKIILTLLIIFLILPLSLSVFFSFFASPNAPVYGIVILLTALFVGLVLILKIWNRIAIRKFWYTLLTIVFIASAITAIMQYFDYKERQVISIAGAEVNLNQYQPFSPETKTVSLNNPSTLQFFTDLPVLDGATALYPLYSAFVKATYPAADYPYLGSPVMCNKTGTAYNNLIEGKVDIIFVAGPSKEQRQAAVNAGKELVLTPIGYEAFVFFVNSRNPVNGLSLDQIKDIYEGKLTKWNQLGGKNKPIKAFQRPEGSGSQTRLIQMMAGRPLMKAPQEDVVEFMGGIVARTADYKNYDNAIGYSFLFYLTGMLNNDQVKLLAIDGVYPNAMSIKDGTYPINTTMYAVTAGSPNPNTKTLINWILSREGQELVAKTGYTPL
jgi:phosphate transport system substrate-binding protein